MISESNTERCANEDVGPSKKVDREIPCWLDMGTEYSL